ncbi:hypothetical protein ATANTOWER_030885 [Ataeniobius toweri]|uniref:Bromo domain-containing protein n=1 Tax=Ataeniobius toweri TaxID=208326 RepID=A0ABU7BNB5_9TELE|nr:hypothetical protein [Ataeniobius toweri]
MKCHVPTIKIFPQGDFLCTFCRSIATPEIEYCDESKVIKGDQSLNPEDQRKCERLLLYIFCHELSMGFREPVASSVPNYYKIIKQPMDLKKVKKKLQLRSSQYYKSIQEFVDDMRLIFKNCAKYNEMSRIIRVYDEEKEINTQAGSEMAISGKAVSLYFEEKLQEMFPDQNFPDSPDPESSDEKDREDVDTEDSEEDFIQPRRKRLKTDEKKGLPGHVRGHTGKINTLHHTCSQCLEAKQNGQTMWKGGVFTPSSLGLTDSGNFTSLCPNGSQWVWEGLGECAQDGRDMASVCLGLLSIVCFMVSSLPQYYSSCKKGNMDSALSIWFLLLWLGGDSCNLVGSFLANQLPLQVISWISYFMSVKKPINVKNNDPYSKKKKCLKRPFMVVYKK